MAIKRVDKTSKNGKRYHSYYIDGQWVPGVTTVLKVLHKEALFKWAPKAVAEWVADNLDEVTEMRDWDREDIVNELKGKPWAKRDAAADRGTEVHGLAERLVRGELVDVPLELERHVDNYVEFLNTWNPKPILVEGTVASRQWMYGGQVDLVADLPNGERAILDLKTGSGVYGNMGLQVGAYRHCDRYLDASGTEQRMDSLGIDAAYIVHVTADEWSVRPVEADLQQYKIFTHLLWVYRNASDDTMKTWLGAPAGAPVGVAS